MNHLEFNTVEARHRANNVPEALTARVACSLSSASRRALDSAASFARISSSSGSSAENEPRRSRKPLGELDLDLECWLVGEPGASSACPPDASILYLWMARVWGTPSAPSVSRPLVRDPQRGKKEDESKIVLSSGAVHNS